MANNIIGCTLLLTSMLKSCYLTTNISSSSDYMDYLDYADTFLKNQNKTVLGQSEYG